MVVFDTLDASEQFGVAMTTAAVTVVITGHTDAQRIRTHTFTRTMVIRCTGGAALLCRLKTNFTVWTVIVGLTGFVGTRCSDKR